MTVFEQAQTIFVKATIPKKVFPLLNLSSCPKDQGHHGQKAWYPLLPLCPEAVSVFFFSTVAWYPWTPGVLMNMEKPELKVA